MSFHEWKSPSAPTHHLCQHSLAIFPSPVYHLSCYQDHTGQMSLIPVVSNQGHKVLGAFILSWALPFWLGRGFPMKLPLSLRLWLQGKLALPWAWLSVCIGMWWSLFQVFFQAGISRLPCACLGTWERGTEDYLKFGFATLVSNGIEKPQCIVYNVVNADSIIKLKNIP